MAMGGPPGLGFVYMLRAIHDAARDAPEDFIDRVAPGLDDASKANLKRGVDAAHELDLWRTWAFRMFIVGLFVILAAFFAAAWTPELGVWFLGLGLAWWGAGLVCLVVSFAVYVQYRHDLHRLMAFVRAARGSSIGRDLA